MQEIKIGAAENLLSIKRHTDSFSAGGFKGKTDINKNLKPGFRIESLEPVQVMAFLVNGQKKEYQWKEDKVYIKDPITENGKCSVSLHVKDSAGNEKTSEEIQFFL